MKRSMNSFFLFAAANRKRFAQEHPTLHNAEVSALLGEAWKKLTDDEKRPYKEAAAAKLAEAAAAEGIIKHEDCDGDGDGGGGGGSGDVDRDGAEDGAATAVAAATRPPGTSGGGDGGSGGGGGDGPHTSM